MEDKCNLYLILLGTKRFFVNIIIQNSYIYNYLNLLLSILYKIAL